ncbi:MAG: DUF1638 domain-containing protein [Anaerolineae bacterium]|nr:DUF1638 domain-containing protein [Anaerolineae bacterium]
MQHLIALTCEALARSVYAIAAASPHTISVQLYKQGLHNHPKHLRDVLQTQIDAIAPGACDAILLVYGMCGTATVGLTTPHTPLVIPRAHDCITLYLGAGARYQAEFERHPGTYWYSVDYMERAEDQNKVALGAAGLEAEQEQYEEYVRKFGQETADLLIEEMRGWARHYTRAAFIDTGLGDSAPFEQMARDKAAREGWVFERLAGDHRLLKLLLDGQWAEDEFLVVPPGYTIRQTFGDGLIEAVPAPGQADA